MDAFETIVRPFVWAAAQCMPRSDVDVTAADAALAVLVAAGSLAAGVWFVRALTGRGEARYRHVKRMVLD